MPNLLWLDVFSHCSQHSYNIFKWQCICKSSISTSSFSYDSICKYFTVRITVFSDSSTSVTAKWSSDSVWSFLYKSADSIFICPSIFSVSGICVPKYFTTALLILTGKNILMEIIWSCTYEHRHNSVLLIIIYGLPSVEFGICLCFVQKNVHGTGNPANKR